MSELSKTIRASHIKDGVHTHLVEASPGQCAALAALFGLPDIAMLQGRFALTHERGGVIAAQLHLTAKLTQICVITLEPFTAKIDEHAALRFVPAQKMREDADIGEVDAETLEGPDEIPYTGDTIDLGAALAEQLALSLDPYPRKPGAELPPDLNDDTPNPFAILKPDH
jgi:uncharacterized metal-binding protein YceD (DUF177 family)